MTSGRFRAEWLRYLKLVWAYFRAWLERDMRPMEIVYSVGMAVVGVVSAYSAFQTSRLDTAFNAIGEIKVQVTATGKDVEYLRRDMDEVRDAVQSIDGKLASADPLKKPTTFAVKDPGNFGKYLQDTGYKGPIYIYSEDPAAEELMRGYLKQE